MTIPQEFIDIVNPDKVMADIYKKKIYVASSWRNEKQPEIIELLRKAGHEVYDFKADNGFHWSDISPGWENWSNQTYMQALRHEIAEKGYKNDFDAMEWADTFVLVQPCGRSAHLELGWACGAGKKTAILLGDEIEPELMSKMADLITDSTELLLEFLND